MCHSLISLDVRNIRLDVAHVGTQLRDVRREVVVFARWHIFVIR
jgi:hypothetical protein